MRIIEAEMALGLEGDQPLESLKKSTRTRHAKYFRRMPLREKRAAQGRSCLTAEAVVRHVFWPVKHNA